MELTEKYGNVSKLEIYKGLKWNEEYLSDMMRIKRDGHRNVRREQNRVDTNYYKFMDPALGIYSEAVQEDDDFD